MGDDTDSRLREHPRDRFAPAERLLDLDDAYEELIDEPHEPVDGHRQITVAHRKGLTIVLFHFEEGGHIPDHQVDGEISLHVLEGDLAIETPDNSHRVRAGQMLILEPGVGHDVEANAETRMLLTISVGERDA